MSDKERREIEQAQKADTNRIFTLPNLLSFFRLLLIPVIIAFYVNQKYWWAFAMLLLSGALDDMQSVANAFLALYGMLGTTQGDIDEANRTRVLSLAEGGRAEFVVKDLNHEALGQLENNLRRSILQLSMTPDLSDDSFAGNTSGVALQYKLWGIEQVRSAKERSFTPSLRALLDALSGGYLTEQNEETLEGTPCLRLSLDTVAPSGAPVQCAVWLDKATLIPLYGEFSQNGQVVLTVKMLSFTCRTEG